jgi:uncharacterized protein
MASVQDKTWNMKKVMKSLYKYEKERRKGKSGNEIKKLYSFTVHGGEPLLLPFNDLRLLLQYSYKKYKSSGIQTSLLHMTDEHLELFKKYKTKVGVSIDGHTPKMNKMRFPIDMTEKQIGFQIDRVFKNIEKLIQSNVSVSVIAILRKCNSNPAMMIDYFHYLQFLGIEYAKLNPGTVYDESKRELLEASNNDIWNVYTAVYRQKLKLTINPIADAAEGMTGHIGNLSCSMKYCDPWSSGADMTLNGNGEFGTCMHTAAAIDGVQAMRGSKPTYERYEALQQIPQKVGGCRGCVFWHMCTGGCPGAGINNDWRNKTRFCGGLKSFYKFIYYDLKNAMPNIYLTPDFFPEKPDIDYIKKSISKSIYQRQYRLSKPRKKNKGWVGIDKGDGIIYQDSNSKEWLEKNPGWGKK